MEESNSYYLIKVLPKDFYCSLASLNSLCLDLQIEIHPKDRREIIFICNDEQLEKIAELFLSQDVYYLDPEVSTEVLGEIKATYMGIRISFYNNFETIKLKKNNEIG